MLTGRKVEQLKFNASLEKHLRPVVNLDIEIDRLETAGDLVSLAKAGELGKERDNLLTEKFNPDEDTLCEIGPDWMDSEDKKIIDMYKNHEGGAQADIAGYYAKMKKRDIENPHGTGSQMII